MNVEQQKESRALSVVLSILDVQYATVIWSPLPLMILSVWTLNVSLLKMSLLEVFEKTCVCTSMCIEFVSCTLLKKPDVPGLRPASVLSNFLKDVES